MRSRRADLLKRRAEGDIEGVMSSSLFLALSELEPCTAFIFVSEEFKLKQMHRSSASVFADDVWKLDHRTKRNQPAWCSIRTILRQHNR